MACVALYGHTKLLLVLPCLLACLQDVCTYPVLDGTCYSQIQQIAALNKHFKCSKCTSLRETDTVRRG